MEDTLDFIPTGDCHDFMGTVQTLECSGHIHHSCRRESSKNAVRKNITQEQKRVSYWTQYINQLRFWYTGLNLDSNRKRAINEEDVSLFNDNYLNHDQFKKNTTRFKIFLNVSKKS